ASWASRRGICGGSSIASGRRSRSVGRKRPFSPAVMRGGVKRKDHLRHIGSDSNGDDINNEEALIRYHLDDLSRAEREAIEQRLAADPVYFEALAALEDDLILRWHRGELPDRQQRWFALAYFSSPSRQARVAAGRRLIEDIQRWKASAAAGSSPWDPVWWFWRSGLGDRVRFAGGAAVAPLVPGPASAAYPSPRWA